VSKYFIVSTDKINGTVFPVSDDVIPIVNIEWGKGCVDTIGKEFVQLVRISSINSAHSE